MTSASPATVRRVAQALRRAEPIPEGTADVAQLLVDQAAGRNPQRRAWVQMIAAGLFIANFFREQDVDRWFYLIAGLCYLGLAISMARNTPRAMLRSAARLGITPSPSPADRPR